MKRRELLAMSSMVTPLSIAGCAAPQRGEPADDEKTSLEDNGEWPMFLYDSTNTRCFAGDHTTAGEPSRQWSYETGDAIWSSPVVTDGTLYVGSYDTHLYAISIETGDLLWRYQAGDRIDGTPAVANGMVYFGAFDRNIYALDAETGEERWIYGTRGIVRSSPTVRDSVLFVGAHCRAEECGAYYDVQWPEQGAVYAIDADRGDLRWRYETDDGVVSTAAVDGDTVYVGSSDNTLYAIDASTGEARWSYGAGGSILSSPTYANGRVFFGTVDGTVYAIDAADGEVQWVFGAGRSTGDGVDLSAVITGSPVLCDGTVYVGAIVPGDELYGELYAISASDGSRKWTASPFAQAIGSSPVVVNDTVYFGAHTFGSSPGLDPGVYALNEDGIDQWSYTVDGEEHRGFGSSPAIVDTTLYIGSTDGHVHTFDLSKTG